MGWSAITPQFMHLLLDRYRMTYANSSIEATKRLDKIILFYTIFFALIWIPHLHAQFFSFFLLRCLVCGFWFFHSFPIFFDFYLWLSQSLSLSFFLLLIFYKLLHISGKTHLQNVFVLNWDRRCPCHCPVHSIVLCVSNLSCHLNPLFPI